MGRIFLAVLTAWCLNVTAARAQQFRPVEFQYIEAIRSGDVEKARSLAKLGNISPNNIQGQPVISWVPRGPTGFLYLSPGSFNYLIDELKQSWDAPLWKEQRTIFSTMCGYLADRDNIWNDDHAFSWGYWSIEAGLKRGAKATEWPGAAMHMRARQPFPECVKAYVRYATHPTRKGELLQTLSRLIDKGADVNYGHRNEHGVLIVPLSRAAFILDVELFKLLTSRGASLSIRGVDTMTCAPFPADVTNPLLYHLKDPKDADVAQARAFLIAYMEAGGDVRAPVTYQTMSGQCVRHVKALKQRALDAGQVAYAQMVQDLEEKAPQLTRPREARAAAPVRMEQRAETGSVQRASAPSELTGSRMLTKNINIRGAAGLDGVVLGKLGPGALVSIIQRSEDGAWVMVTLPTGNRAWMHGDTLRDGSHAVR